MQIHTADRLSVSLTRDVHAAAPADDAIQAAEALAIESIESAALLQALLAGQDVPMAWPGMKAPCKLSCILAELGYAHEKALLLRAVHLCLAGKFEASSLVLREFAQATCALYGREMAECAS